METVPPSAVASAVPAPGTAVRVHCAVAAVSACTDLVATVVRVVWSASRPVGATLVGKASCSDGTVGKTYLLRIRSALSFRRLLGLGLLMAVESGGEVEFHHHVAPVKFLCKRRSLEFV